MKWQRSFTHRRNSTWAPLTLITIISLFGSWSIARFNMSWLSWAQQSISTSSAGQCEILWRYTICCYAPTLNNPQDLDLDCLAASFPVQWIRAHGSRGKRQCGVNSVPDTGAPSCWKRKSSFDERRMSGSNPCSVRYDSNRDCLF